MAACCQAHELAWDCATGNGQAARSIAPYFQRVIATDASDAQIAAANQHKNVEFRVAPAEASNLESVSVDLITVAQALHWFDIERFFQEVCRVLKPQGVLAIWSYARCLVNPDCDAIIEKVFAEVEPFWPPERLIVENQYRGIELPVPELVVDAFDMQLEWRAEQMLAYMRTWSAARRYQATHGAEPVARFAAELRDCWGPGKREVRWPLTLRAGRMPA